MITKNIIQRNLPLTQCYNLMETKYISLIDGFGCTCDNCGKLIANIATVKGENDNSLYSIGFDCLDTFLLNNQLLRGEDIEQYNAAKKSMPKVKRIKEYFKDFLTANPFICKVNIVKEGFLTDWLTYNFFNAAGKQVWNDGYKVKDLSIQTLMASLTTIKNIEFNYIDNG